MPANCTATAATADVITFDCPPFGDDVSLLHLDTGVLEPLSISVDVGYGDTEVYAAGTHWFYVRKAESIFDEDRLYNRATGAMTGVDPFGARRAIDLDAPGGSAPLCRGLRRTKIPQYKTSVLWEFATRVGRYVLLDVRDGRRRVDCRTGKRVKSHDTTLNRTVAAYGRGYLTPAAVLTDLRSGDRTVFKGQAAVTLSRGAAWFTDPTGAVSVLPLAPGGDRSTRHSAGARAR